VSEVKRLQPLSRPLDSLVAIALSSRFFFWSGKVIITSPGSGNHLNLARQMRQADLSLSPALSAARFIGDALRH